MTVWGRKCAIPRTASLTDWRAISARWPMRRWISLKKRSGLSTTVCRIDLHLDAHRAPKIYAVASAGDPQSAFDLALDKIDRQVVAFKEKVTHRKQAASPVRVPPDESRGRRRPAEP